MRRFAIALVALATMYACGKDFVHTNPYDPDTPFTGEIVGPDILYSVGEFGQYTLASTPTLPDTAGVWGSNSDSFRSAQFGRFQVWHPPLWPQTETIEISLVLGGFDSTASGDLDRSGSSYRRRITRTISVTQRLVSISLRCPSAHACAPAAVGGTWSVWVDGLDALGSQIFGFTDPSANPSSGSPLATFVARDPTVASVSALGVRAATVIALKPGSTWIVATRGTLTDSLQITAH